MTFAIAKQTADSLYHTYTTACAALDVFVASHGGPGQMGLTPDHVKAMPEFQSLKRNADASFAALRNFNVTYTKQYKRELIAEREARRASQRKLA
jgi:hypothetical protein